MRFFKDIRRFRRLIPVLFFVTLSATAGIPEFIPGQYIVVLHEDAGPPAATAQGLSMTYGLDIRATYSHAVRGFTARIAPSLMPSLLSDPRIAYIEQDRVMRAIAQTVPTGIDRIDADTNPQSAIDGRDAPRIDVDIAIIDTGVDPDHPDLNVVQFHNCIDSVDDDQHGHGTHVAGTAAAIDNDIDVVGVAPGARLWAVKVLDANGVGSTSSLICGIDYVTQNADAIEVANMSVGGRGHSQAMQDAIAASVGKGVVYVVAAGNDSSDVYGFDGIQGTNDDFTPAAYPEVAAVSALADFDGKAGGEEFGVFDMSCPGLRFDKRQNDDTLACFSNFSSQVVDDNPVTSPGKAIDVAAPGYSILSTFRNGGTAVLSGTSMASPHVAGVAALYIVKNGRARNAKQVHAIRQALIDEGQPQALWRAGGTRDPDGNLEPMAFLGDASDAIRPPSAPGDLVATAVNTDRIDLQWNDTSANENGYSLERRKQSGAFAEIAQLPTDTSAYSDQPLETGTRYSYRVRAFNTFGNSPYSGIASARTLTSPPASGTMHVDSIRLDIVSVFFGLVLRVQAEVRVIDENGLGAADATVAGDWSRNGTLFTIGATGKTDRNGLAILTTPNVVFPKPSETFEFCVADISGGPIYDSSKNTETCDSVVLP